MSKFAAMGGGALLLLAGLVVHVAAQEPEPSATRKEEQAASSPDDMIRRWWRCNRECIDGMERTGMPDGMLQACRVRMSAPIRYDDPAALLALKAELVLTAEQIEKLTALVERTRAEAKRLLTEAQAKKLDTLLKSAAAFTEPGKTSDDEEDRPSGRRSGCCPCAR